MKLGLKLWSNNENYINHAEKLHEDGCFDFIELYSVANSAGKYLDLWKALKIPYIIHAPHESGGFNLADMSKKTKNAKLFDEAKRFADKLGAPYIIVHAGVLGDHGSLRKQLGMLDDNRILLENMTFKTLDMMGTCAGASPDEIKSCITVSNTGFCFDIAHAVKYSISKKKDYLDVIKDFLKMKPPVIHLSGIDNSMEMDRHLHLKDSDIDFKKIIEMVLRNKPEFCTLETPKDSTEDLEDFKEDIDFLRKLLTEI